MFITKKRYNSIIRRLETLESAAPQLVVGNKKMTNEAAIEAVMCDGISRTASKVTKEINERGLTKWKAMPASIGSLMALVCRQGKLVRVEKGIYKMEIIR